MNSLSIIFIIIIILAFLYLYMKYRKYNKVLESFDNINTVQPTQSSLSTYFQNNVDSDIINKSNMYNNPTINRVSKNNGWTGIWRTNDHPNFNSSFVQNNDKLLISFSNSSLDEVFSNIINNRLPTTNNCPSNLFLGVAQLNNSKNIFNLTKIICNNYINNHLDLSVNKFSGKLSEDKKSIQLFPDGKVPITLYKYYIYDVEENHVINENNLKDGTISNTSLEECKKTCNDNNHCRGFSFENSTKNCYLKNNTHNKTTNSNYTTYIKQPKLIDHLPDTDNYINSVSSFVNNYPQIPLNNFSYKENYCENGTKPCYDKSNGIALTTYSGIKYNACGIPTSSTDNTCVEEPSCMIADNPINGIPICNINYKLNDYMNSNAFGELSQKTGSTLNICENISAIKKCNSFIICYINNIGNVYTLNYQFFGSLPEESKLTVQSDIMNTLLNNKNHKIGLLPFYRDIIKTNNSIHNSHLKNTIKALSFTNCLENNNLPSSSNNRISSSVSCANKYVNNYNISISNDNLKPALWEINSDIKNNIINSCSIRLNTSSKYNTPKKYVKYNIDGSINLSFFSGGNNEELIMENYTIVQDVNYSNTSYIAITTNLKTNDQLYLIPSTDSGFSNNSNLVGLTKSPLENGKWLLIGFNINNINQLDNTFLKKIMFTYNNLES